MKNYPEWKKTLWRMLRTSVAAALGQVVIFQPDLSDPMTSFKTLGVAVLAGFLVALAKQVRDVWGSESDVVRKMPL